LIWAAGVGGRYAARIGPIQREIRISSRFGFGYLPFRHNNHVIVITGRVAIAADWALAVAREGEIDPDRA
jgi:hypothetical protein